MDSPEIPKHRPQTGSVSSLTSESAESLLTVSASVPHIPSHRPHKHATGVSENENLKINILSPQVPFSRPQRSKISDINEIPLVPKRRPVAKDIENDVTDDIGDSTENIPIIPSKRPSIHKSELSNISILPNKEPFITPSSDPIESNLSTSELSIPITSSSVSSSPIIPSSRPQKAIDSTFSPSVTSRGLTVTPGTEDIELQSAKECVNEPTHTQLKDNENSAEIKESEDNVLVTKKGNETSEEGNLPTVEKDGFEFIIPTSRPSKSVSNVKENLNSVEKESELKSKTVHSVPAEKLDSKVEDNIGEKKAEMVPDERQIENVCDAKNLAGENDIKDNIGDKGVSEFQSSFPTIPLARPNKAANEPETEKDVGYAGEPGHTEALVSFPNTRPRVVNGVELGPKTPLKRPSLKQNNSEDGIESGSEKKIVPKVPKKPSSKIAQFQMMLEQQQKQDLGLMNMPKHKPKPPVKHPTILDKDVTEESKEVDIPEPEEKEVAGASPKVGKLSTRFTQNLNGMIGMALPGMGMALDGTPAASFQAATLSNEIKDEKDIHEAIPVKDVRRARARGPRGRKLPGAVKKTVEINDETLGNKFTIFVEDSWSFSFKKPVIKEAEEEKEEKEPNTEYRVGIEECLENVSDEKNSEASEGEQNDLMTATEGIVEPKPSIEDVSEWEQDEESDYIGKVVTGSLDSNLGSLELSLKEESLEPLEGQIVSGSPVTSSSVLSSSEDGIVEDGDHTSSGILSV